MYVLCTNMSIYTYKYGVAKTVSGNCPSKIDSANSR